MDLNNLWQNVLGEIELTVSKANFITWFKNTNIHSKKDGVITISAPNGFTKEWLENKYKKFILKILRDNYPEVKDVQFVIGGIKINPKPPIQQPPKKEKPDFLEDQLNFNEFNVNKETNLNPKYTFDNFIVGGFNELAQAAGKAIVKHLGTLYNPLFLYGGVGLGKTHLMQAIGNEIAKKYPSKKIKYLSSEKYGSELVNAISKRGMEPFKKKYKDVDVLIIDDIQFIAGKEKTQEEFFHTFNALHQLNKQIIISSDRHPKSIATLEERLRSRFEGGMIADISFPDIETRLAIIKTKVKEKNFDVSDDILNYLATHIQRNIRELEGALNRIIAYAQLNEITPTIERTSKMFSQIVSSPKKITTFKKIVESVAEFYDIDVNDLINRSRKKEIVHPRQITMFLVRQELNRSYPFIGQKLGGRDHTTVMYACQKINKEVQINESIHRDINLIKERIYA
ncbi:chromosomal replication initiator protein DnaA [Patescibacteria group bacterium]